MSDTDRVAEFLEAVYGRGSGYVHLSTTNRQLAAVRCSEVADLAAVIDGKVDVYLSAAVIGTERGSGGAGRIEDPDASELTALWVDLDRAGEPGHKGAGNYWTRDDLRALWEWLPVHPTAVVDSGGGWWFHYALDEPVALNGDRSGELLLARWARLWEGIGERFDRQMDGVFNPSRIARAPGSINGKEGLRRPAFVKSLDPDRVLTVDALDELLPAPEPPRYDWKPSALNGDRPGDVYNKEATPAAVVRWLEGHGFHSPRHKSNGRLDLTRSGKNARDGHSVTVWPDATMSFWSSAPEALPGTITLRDKLGASGTYDPFGAFVHADHKGDFEAAARALNPPSRIVVPSAAPSDSDDETPTAAGPRFRVVDALAFASEAEDGADPLLGDVDDALIPEGDEVLIFGDGGAGKTTLAGDLGCHLAAGDDWLGITVKRPLAVLFIENEGPRPLFRRKLARKLESWAGTAIQGTLHVLEDPWATFTFADEEHRRQLAEQIRALELDVVVVGPITVAGMDEAGTIQDTRAFQALLAEVRVLSGRRVTFILIHHENKGGKVSGAWEGTGDTLLHVHGMGHGKTRLHIQKARWAPTWHARTLNLLWADGESFTVVEAEEVDAATVATRILEYITENPGTGWTKVEEATPGIARQRRRHIRDQMLSGGGIVNVAKIEGAETVLDHVPERKQARLYRADDPTIRHLRPDPGADAAQTAPPGGEVGDAQLRPAPRRITAQGVGAPVHPLEMDLFDGAEEVES